MIPTMSQPPSTARRACVKAHPIALILLCGLLPQLAFAQTLYRCQEGAKVTYSDRSCSAGTVKRISADGGPTIEEREAARARLHCQVDSHAAREAKTRDLELGAAKAADERRAAAPIRATPDPRDNEKVLVGTQSGWDYKTRGQLRAEAAARNGHPVSPTGGNWETEKTTTHGSSGWGTSTRLDAAKTEGERQRRRDQDSGFAIINGQPYAKSGPNGVIDPKTGKYCPLVGNTAFCN